MDMYCEKCCMPFDGDVCPVCGSKRVRKIKPDDVCFLTEQTLIYGGMLADVLTKNNIPFIKKNVLGAGITVRTGAMFERVRFYVFYQHFQRANDIVEELFSSSDGN